MAPRPQQPTTQTEARTGSGTFRSREPAAGRAAFPFILHAPHREPMLGEGPKLVPRTAQGAS